MTRWRKFDIAKEDAATKGVCVGFCVLDGMFYVGTREQLAKIACIDIEDPKEVFKCDGPTSVSSAGS